MKKVSIISYIFALVGIGMLAGAIYLFTNTQAFLDKAAVSEGVVIDLALSRSSDSTTYQPIVEFTTDTGIVTEFVSSSGSNPPSYHRGETVEVLYDRADPYNARINGFFSLWGGATIVGGIGAVFFLIGFGILLVGKLGKRKAEYLKQNGVAVQAKFQSVELNGSVQVNGRSPYRIFAQWINPTTSEMHIFKSENIWFDPTAHIESDELTVLIEKDNPKKHYMDISFLPQIAD